MVVSTARSLGPLGLQRFTVRAHSRLGPVRLLRYVLGAALLLALTAAPAWARWATRFQDAAAKAPLIVRARVLASSPALQDAATQGTDVQLAVERTLVGPSVGSRLTLEVRCQKSSSLLREGGLYLLILESPSSLYSDHNSCGTVNILEVVGGKVPHLHDVAPSRPSLADYLFGHLTTLAEAEAAITALRCPDGQLCPDEHKSHRLTACASRFTPQHLLMLMAALALAGYSWWLARSRAAEGVDEGLDKQLG